ncbi:3-keto-disaccharide hydrolase [Algoriphagus machipongonensis]|uniref:3-keto-alpha-glucoside-1,2-lyase/3-keto-2-hydroxy-glucal hydratase domain-containing protein n=1 Tax=Algoriphagus machipongonensis TaxID=388413 RepID=A3I0Y0_9BACT|nr:DUF1080 domain-containing protein [Algoriphagus machipongonensis]EAZ80126.1 hypothetical protein ALPR1_15894 [Algoriphagus machipongonensis]
MKNLTLLVLCSLVLFACSSGSESSNEEVTPKLEWRELFNGNDLENWVVKISKHEVNENFGNTFRVADGMMQVRYDEYDEFDRQYGHIFYDEAFSNYVLQVQYRFVGEQANGGEGWAWRNSGAMLHGQDPRTMLKDQDFPISVEAQFLGGNGTDERSTCNLCTPGTNVVLADTLFTPHCINSSSKTYAGDQWVTANFVVLGDSAIHHMVGLDTVFSYNKPQIGGGNVNPSDPAVKIDGKLLKEGFISLQSESHPIDFRKVSIVEIDDLIGQDEKLNEAVITLLSDSK